eukprot:COSAG01_NODE_1280_length_10925_cov_23.969333_13_plen_78_part_00
MHLWKGLTSAAALPTACSPLGNWKDTARLRRAESGGERCRLLWRALLPPLPSRSSASSGGDEGNTVERSDALTGTPE